VIRRATGADVEGCVAVLASLPDHFTADTHDDLRAMFDRCDVWVADVDGHVVGCMLLERRYPGSGEIHYAGVRPERRRQGLGRQLVEAVFAGAGVPVIEVKTLDASSSYEPYVATRAFWEAMGFLQIDCIDPLPGWQPGNPSAIYVRFLDR
jgi:N-acetylglutamate synthase-like GNAT family acetyltransferase